MAPSSFSTLPLELKARIVEMANDQEDMWWERVKDKDPKAEERAGHINSLGALALVNKEFRALAATHQFRQLDGNLAARPIFRFTILPFYGHHITEVTFYVGDSVEGCDNALSAMGQFPALDTLRFEGDQALELFGSFQSPVPSDTVAAYRNRTLDLVAPKIKTLVLYGFDPAEASAVVRRFPNATSLGLSDMEAPGNAEAPASLAAIANLVHSRGIDPSVLDRPHLTPFHPDAKMDYTTVEQPFLSQNLRRTLEFGLVELDRMDGEGNVAKAVGWVEKLRPLEEERLAWKD
ncbi:hypothetical protein RQP46_002536 [Phenoliferia psychrophenolica]